MNNDRIFEFCRINDTPVHALHFKWDNLSDIFSALLTGLFQREIIAQTERVRNYCWYIGIYNTSLAQVELETLFDLADADDFDRDQHEDAKSLTNELCQSLCRKLMGKLLPFVPVVTLADDDGVWFTSFSIDSSNKPRITIHVSGGMVQNVYSNLYKDMEVVVLDFDGKQDMSDAEITEMQHALDCAASKDCQIY